MYRGLLTKEDRRRKQKRRRICQGIAAACAAMVIGLAAGVAAREMRFHAAESGEERQQAVCPRAEPLKVTTVTEDTGEEKAAEKKEEPVSNDEILVVLDPGHGGEDEGCSKAGVLEKELNLQIAMKVREKLLELGYRVLMTREEDRELSLQERTEAANHAGGQLFISIHQNAAEASDAEGIETWYFSGDGEGASEENGQNSRLARLVHQSAMEQTEAKDRGVKGTAELYVIREADMPACLIETGFLSNAGERNRLTDSSCQESLAEGIARAADLFFHPKTMYLTFDDGPSEENTAAVLDILKKKNIKATFFLVGENVKKHPDVAKRIVNEGHTVGIHCNSHDYRTLYESTESYLEDFREAYDTIKAVTGAEPKLFRFPGGSINAYNQEVYKKIIEEMTAEGFVYFDWNASLEDAVHRRDPETLLQNARSSTLGRKKVVMLAHDIVYETTLCLEEMIEAFPEYRMLPLTEDVEPVQF